MVLDRTQTIDVVGGAVPAARSKLLRMGAAVAGLTLLVVGAVLSHAHTPGNIVKVELSGRPSTFSQLVLGAAPGGGPTAVQRYLDSLPWDYAFIGTCVAGLALLLWVGHTVLGTASMRRFAAYLAWAAVLAGALDVLENVALHAALTQLKARPADGAAREQTWLSIAQGAAFGKFILVVPAAIIALGSLLAGLARLRAVPTITREDIAPAAVDPLRPFGTPAYNRALPPGRTAGGPGICLSGGGVRSTTFALGAWQVLAEHRIVEKATYLTSVSGGSYFTGAEQITRHDLTPAQQTQSPAYSAGSVEEAWLRRHGKYVADSWQQWGHALLVLLRGVVVNLGVIFLTLFCVARLAGEAYVWAGRPGIDGSRFSIPRGVVWACAAAAGAAVLAWLVYHALSGISARLTRRLRVVAAWFFGIAGSLAVMGLGVPLLAQVSQRFLTKADHVPFIGSSAVLVAVGYVSTLITISGKAKGLIPGPAKTGRVSKVTPKVVIRVAIITATIVLVGAAVLLMFGALLHDAVVVHPGGASGTIPLDDRWVTAAAWAVLAVLYLCVDEVHWSLFPFYFGRIGRAFAPRRDADGVAIARDPGEVMTLSRYAGNARRSGHPQLIVCASAGVSGQGFAAAQRRAVPFTFSHDWVGSPQLGYVRTATYERLLRGKTAVDGSLLGAVAISGSAFASAMGRFTSPFNWLLTLTNARLGSWLPNPLHARLFVPPEGKQTSDAWFESRFPARRRLSYLAKELVSAHSPDDRLVFLADGGHYENLGLVELLRHRCDPIYVIDASGDDFALFTALDQAVVLAQEELGVTVTMHDMDGLAPAGRAPDDVSNPTLGALAARTSAKCVAVGTISYPADGTHPASTGTVFFGKALLTPDTPWPIMSFAGGDRAFPNDSTADQWFDADRFDAYLALGRHVASELVELSSPHRSVSLRDRLAVSLHGR